MRYLGTTAAQSYIATGTDSYCFSIHEQIDHYDSHLHQYEVSQEKYTQMYVSDSDIPLLKRMNIRENLQHKKRKQEKVWRWDLTLIHMHFRCFMKWKNMSLQRKDQKVCVCMYAIKISQRTSMEADTMHQSQMT